MLLTSWHTENNTLGATGIATLWCPSDYGVATAQGIYYPTASGQMVQDGYYWGNSYSAVTGPWEWDGFNLVPGTLDQLVPGEAQRIAQLGLIYPLSSVRLAQVTDGMSNTLLFSETDCTAWYTWWTVGDGYHTLVSTCAPPNAPMIIEGPFSTFSVDSLHPGGANCAFGDGSVKFIKNSINSWPFDTDAEWSPSLGWNPVTQVYYILPGATVGVWQAYRPVPTASALAPISTESAGAVSSWVWSRRSPAEGRPASPRLHRAAETTARHGNTVKAD